jgi:hypothetical protein
VGREQVAEGGVSAVHHKTRAMPKVWRERMTRGSRRSGGAAGERMVNVYA